MTPVIADNNDNGDTFFAGANNSDDETVPTISACMPTPHINEWKLQHKSIKTKFEKNFLSQICCWLIFAYEYQRIFIKIQNGSNRLIRSMGESELNKAWSWKSRVRLPLSNLGNLQVLIALAFIV
jgi:hypothetical protein